MSLSSFDFILLFIAAIFALLSLRRGILYEVASIASWAAAFFIAQAATSALTDVFLDILVSLFPDEEILSLAFFAPVLTFISILILSFLVIAFFLRRIASIPSQNTQFKIFERSFGSIIIGFAKTYALAALLLMIYQSLIPILKLEAEPPFIVDSFSYFYIESLTLTILDFLVAYS
jgi:uncharacterized membrane protein required for colicin V production